MHLALVGMMGSGKSTVGRRAAEALGRPFFDSDEMIEAREGRTVREIWLSDGEPAYRELETVVLEQALASGDPAVVAAAGGVVLKEENRRLLTRAGVCTVRLVADPEVLVTRVGRQGHRPLLDEDPLAALRRLAGEREALYRDVAVATVETGRAPVDEVVDEVLRVLATCEAP